jgi:hypothetical protein
MAHHNDKPLTDFAADLKACIVSLGGDHEAEALLLTCMDFRFFELIAEEMASIGLTGQYDQVILAGAALGAVVPAKPADPCWHQTFFDHLGLARKLHNIKMVLVMEHRDCGAYGPKGFGLLPDKPDPIVERRVHFEQVEKLENRLPRDLGFGAWLLDVPPGPEKRVLTFDKLK